MKINFRFLLSHIPLVKTKKNTDLLSFLTDFTAENAPTSLVTYDVKDELRLLSLSKSCPALHVCHKWRNM